MNKFVLFGKDIITNAMKLGGDCDEKQYGSYARCCGRLDDAWRGRGNANKHKGGATQKNDEKGNENCSQRWLRNAKDDSILKKKTDGYPSVFFFLSF